MHCCDTTDEFDDCPIPCALESSLEMRPADGQDQVERGLWIICKVFRLPND